MNSYYVITITYLGILTVISDTIIWWRIHFNKIVNNNF